MGEGLGIRVQGLKFRVEGLGFRASQAGSAENPKQIEHHLPPRRCEGGGISKKIR